MNTRTKVLQLHPDYNVKLCDVSDLAEQVVKALPRSDYEMTSAYLCGEPKSGQPASIAEHVHYFRLADSELEGLRLKALWRLYRYCRQQQFDVVICNRFKVVSLMLQLNKLLKVPVCIGISHVLDEYRRRYRRWQVRYLADARWHFVGVSDAVRDWLIAYDAGFTAHNTHAIANAIDIAKSESIQLSREQARAVLGLPMDAILVGAIGQLFVRKGHTFLISALARLGDQYPHAQIGIIGRGPEEQTLRQQIADLGLESKVHLLGFRENALQYVRAFDIWAMPSLKEGLPLALMEGMSGHLPVIASDIAEMRDLIVGAGGIAVPTKDAEALALAMASYLALDSATLALKGEQVFDYLTRQHSIESYRNNYLNLIQQTLESNGS